HLHRPREVALADPDLVAGVAGEGASLVGADAVREQYRQHFVGLALVEVCEQRDATACGQQQARRQHQHDLAPCARPGCGRDHFYAPVWLGQDCCRNSCCTPSDVRLATFEVSCDWNRNLWLSMVISSIWLGVRSPVAPLMASDSDSISLALELRLSNAEIIICVPWDCSTSAAPDTASAPVACGGWLTPAARSWAWAKSRTSIAEACGCAEAPAPPAAPAVASSPAT